VSLVDPSPLADHIQGVLEVCGIATRDELVAFDDGHVLAHTYREASDDAVVCQDGHPEVAAFPFCGRLYASSRYSPAA
jgi:hypothetical protein